MARFGQYRSGGLEAHSGPDRAIMAEPPMPSKGNLPDGPLEINFV
jgi:hypothetical protein